MAVEFRDSELRHLTPAQMEVAKLVAIGYSNQDIADELHTTRNCVKNTVRQIYDRLGVENRVRLSVRLISRGTY
jgi:DNA-binding NarL/FixJ family response regulator